MKKQFCYLIVACDGEDSWGKIVGWSLADGWDDEFNTNRLAEMLADGWEPVRETAMGGKAGDQCVYSLVVLERIDLSDESTG
jgi:hypothetical protein